jgi:hypothetical protein
MSIRPKRRSCFHSIRLGLQAQKSRLGEKNELTKTNRFDSLRVCGSPRNAVKVDPSCGRSCTTATAVVDPSCRWPCATASTVVDPSCRWSCATASAVVAGRAIQHCVVAWHCSWNWRLIKLACGLDTISKSTRGKTRIGSSLLTFVISSRAIDSTLWRPMSFGGLAHRF